MNDQWFSSIPPSNEQMKQSLLLVMWLAKYDQLATECISDKIFFKRVKHWFRSFLFRKNIAFATIKR